MGFCIAYKWDLPIGPTDVALLGALYALAFSIKWLVGVVKKRQANASRTMDQVAE